MWVRSRSREDFLEEGMATHSSIVAWRIPWTEEPGGRQSVGSQRIGYNRSESAHTHSNLLYIYIHTYISFKINLNKLFTNNKSWITQCDKLCGHEHKNKTLERTEESLWPDPFLISSSQERKLKRGDPAGRGGTEPQTFCFQQIFLKEKGKGESKADWLVKQRC